MTLILSERAWGLLWWKWHNALPTVNSLSPGKNFLWPLRERGLGGQFTEVWLNFLTPILTFGHAFKLHFLAAIAAIINCSWNHLYGKARMLNRLRMTRTEWTKRGTKTCQKDEDKSCFSLGALMSLGLENSSWSSQDSFWNGSAWVITVLTISKTALSIGQFF